MAHITLTAPDISCSHCKMTIESELAKSPGVKSVTVDIDTKQVDVDYDDAATTTDALCAEMDEIGYPVA